jgi:hypothetical protein
MLPAHTRDRYGQELLEVLDRSPRPLADTLDVLFLAVREHLEDPMRRPVHTVASVSLAVSLALLGYTVNDLSSGLTELPQHWWSSGAAASVIASGAVALLTRHTPDTKLSD